MVQNPTTEVVGFELCYTGGLGIVRAKIGDNYEKRNGMRKVSKAKKKESIRFLG